LEKKYQIMDVVGKSDDVNLGDTSLTKMAHKGIEDVEIAVTRYLLESSYAALTDIASAEQIYRSNYPKVQSRLGLKRKLDLVTTPSKQPRIDVDDITKYKTDICELAMKNYPNIEENKKRIDELTEYMKNHDIFLG
ncbi:MAG: hypothetical protein LUH11_01735, partial [Candidatus Gastranaerophilales bacterium]|nr:hypothetical protein [Candidatus Gastranaerophilales bacterium]